MDAQALINQFDQRLKRAQTASATWQTDPEEYQNEVKVWRQTYTKFTSMTPAERATHGGSGARALGFANAMRHTVFGTVLKSRAERRAAELRDDGSHAQELRTYNRTVDARDADEIAL